MRLAFLLVPVLFLYGLPVAPARGAVAADLERSDEERILQFDSIITVDPDGSMTVREVIRVRSAGKEIRRGIYRDFPTEYRDRWGWRQSVPVEVLSVLKDGKPEAFHVQPRGNGRRIYVGQSDYHIASGEHTYTLVYKTDRQIGFFPEQDELYWNVTGTGWSFPIDAVSATVLPPAGVSAVTLKVEAYTGAQGAKGRHFTTTIRPDGTALYRTTRPLNKFEGLTIVASWPKGFVREPTASARLRYFLDDNRSLVTGGIGIGLLLLYYGLIWLMRGRDPARALSAPRFEPPDGMSAAAVRYVARMGYDKKCLSAALLGMVVKGYLRILPHDGGFTLRSNGTANSKLTEEEATIARSLFTQAEDVQVGGGYSTEMGQASSALAAALKREYGDCFRRNDAFIAVGAAISFLAFLAAGAPSFPNGFVMFGLLALLVAINVLFALVNRAYTARGRKLMDQIDALRNYLSSNEHRMTDAGRRKRTASVPAVTPDLYERLMPFAAALGLGQAWAQQFAKAAARADRTRSSEYLFDSHYVQDLHWDENCHLDSALSDRLSDVIAAAATAPSSSSGSDGGGSSGGGGGGGGGGGW